MYIAYCGMRVFIKNDKYVYDDLVCVNQWAWCLFLSQKRPRWANDASKRFYKDAVFVRFLENVCLYKGILMNVTKNP